MSTLIQVQNRDRCILNEEHLRQAAQVVLDQHDAACHASLSIIITNEDTMRELNRRHRQSGTPTDVLSFAAPTLPDEISEDQAYLGDVVIAHEFAATKAAAKDASLDETLCLLVIHGTLHLLGYTHDTAAACDKMWAAQARALENMGINRAVVDRYETVKQP